SMENKRVLIITQELTPYLNGTEMSEVVNELPQYLQNHGNELRILMPRYGIINERRHRLHEVVRLSGMNIIINEDDYPLIIKVASLPGSRIQVYFLDNDDLFKRKYVFHDENQSFFEDNAERMVFFCKAALETVKKFQWAPDIIHCHGWMTSLIPLYLKTVYKNEPVLKNAKVVFSMYKNAFEEKLANTFYEKAPITDAVTDAHLAQFKDLKSNSLYMGGAAYSDAVVLASANLDAEVTQYVQSLKKPVLEYNHEEGYLEKYAEFYKGL
ncbi:MAG: glycogen/starch synthase, partial [Chitinophagales bacterium]